MKQKIFGVTVAKLTASFGQTVYMVGLSLFFGAILGIILALVLVLCRKGGLKENRIVYGIVSTFVNIVRSVPFVILIVTIMPLTRAIMGTTIGSTAALVPLIFYISPYMARLVENSLLDHAGQQRGSVCGHAGRHCGEPPTTLSLPRWPA